MSASLRWTSADLLNLPDDGKRREIIDGDLYVSTQPHFYHQVLGGRFNLYLELWSLENGTGFAASAPGLVFADDDDVVPDVIWVSHERLAESLHNGKLHAAPELVIEILSPGSRNIARDRDTKLKLYAQRGADEYWIADWWRHRIEVYRRDGVLLALAEALGPGDTLTSPALPGFSLPIDRLFLGIPFGSESGDGDE